MASPNLSATVNFLCPHPSTSSNPPDNSDTTTARPMASQIYSRYIPPSKKPCAPNHPSTEPSTTALGTEAAAATPPRHASATYARYVPPSKTTPGRPSATIVPDSELTARRKRKGEDVGEDPATKRMKKGKKPRKARDSPQEVEGLNKSRETAAGALVSPAAELKRFRAVKPPSLAASGQDEGQNEPTTKETTPPREPKLSAGSPVIDSTSKLAKNEVDELDKPKKKRTKRVGENVKRDSGGTVTQEKDNGSRHKKLMEKREKSMKKAEKVVQKSKSEPVEEQIQAEKEEVPVEVHDLVPLPQPDPVPEPPVLAASTSLPPWLASPIRVLPTATASFSEVGIDVDVARALQDRGLSEAFAVQAAVLPLLLPGELQQLGDILVSAATGSGKTLAYVLPMIESISRSQTTKLRGLIVMPTRELVTQAKNVCEICASAFPGRLGRKRVKMGTAVGNETLKVEQDMLITQKLLYDPVAYEKQQSQLNEKWENSEDGSDQEALCDEEAVSDLPDHVFSPLSNVDILICTPGRLVEHIKSTPGFTLEHVKWLVVDEADKLLDQSFQQWLEVAMAGIDVEGRSSRPLDRVRKVILSATMTTDVGLLNPLRLYRPKLILLESSSSARHDNIEISQAHVLPPLLLESGVKVEDENIKPLYLMELLKREDVLSGDLLIESSSDPSDDESSSDEKPYQSSAHSTSHETSKCEPDTPRGVLIFTKSNESALRLGRLIALLAPSSSHKIGTLTSTTPRAARKSALKSFATGNVSILVASDLVSRGLDLPNLAHVINYDVPTSLTSYVHRIGRTARAGKRGHAWTLFTASEGRWFWNEIGRTKRVERSSGKIERVNIKAEFFGQEQRGTYEDALAELGREARNLRAGAMVA